MRLTPIQSIICGTVCSIGTIWIMSSLFVFDPAGKHTTSDLTYISGVIQAADHVNERRGAATLQITLADQPFPFRCFDGPYPGSFDKSVLQTMAVGQQARIGVVTVEMQQPRKDRSSGQNFYPFVSLDLAGQSVLTLNAYNEWSVENLRVAQWLLPAFLCCGLYLTYAGVVAKKAGKPFV